MVLVLVSRALSKDKLLPVRRSKKDWEVVLEKGF